MKHFNALFVALIAFAAVSCGSQNGSEPLPVQLLNGEGPVKVFQTPSGNDLGVEFIGHGSVRFTFNEKNIYVDPYSQQADFSSYPAADFVFISHSHPDHYDTAALDCIADENTPFFVGSSVPEYNGNVKKVTPGTVLELDGFSVEIVEAYNIPGEDPEARIFHPQGEGIGFVFDFDGCRVYVAGDTEPTPEMLALTNLDIAFLPKNVPYTMTDEQFIQTANVLKPKYLYPYHFFDPIDYDVLKAGIDETVTIVKK